MSVPKRAAVVVIGGGVIGASVAYHLAARGVRDVVVLDRTDRPGLGSTGKATGGFRAQYGTPINVRLSLLARDMLSCFEEETGVDPGYERAGYLWLATSEAALAALANGNRMQRDEGLSEATMVSPEEIARLAPFAALEGVVGGAFCPTDGFIRPLAILEGYRAASEKRGVRFAWNVEVTGMSMTSDRKLVAAVEWANGVIECDAAVNAAGAWAKSVAAMAGVALPVEPLRRQVLPTVPTVALPASMPMTIWADDGYHLRMRDGRALLLWPSPGAPNLPFETAVDPDWMKDVEAMTRRRVPRLDGVAVDRAGAWGGLYEISPDKHAILGRASECENFYLANGSSGHGVMHAPALGRLLAEIMTGRDGRAGSLDVHTLRPSRFAEGEPIDGPALL
jgi:sarcosine oxidase subunit beta